MLKGVRNYLAGWRTLTVPAAEKALVLDELYQNGIRFTHRQENEDGGVTLFLRERDARRYRMRGGEEMYLSDVRGLPHTVFFLRKRPMLLIGALLFAVWIRFSTGIVWDIRIEGNTKTPDAAILRQLEELGFFVGVPIADVNFDRLHEQYAAVQNDIAWLRVYMNGTAAEVQVRELYADERKKPEANTYANLVADCGGLLEEVNVFEGQAAVRAGDTVFPGQILISGVVEKKEGAIRYEYAEGEVIGVVEVPVTVKIASEREKKAYTGREKARISIKIFKKTINLFRNGGIPYETYDTIDTIEQVCPFGLCAVPVWIGKTVIREYVSERERIPAEDAAAEAMLRLNEQLRRETENAELVGKEVTAKWEGGEYAISCLLRLRRNIGRTVEFTVSE